jgi:hypothetical protein
MPQRQMEAALHTTIYHVFRAQQSSDKKNGKLEVGSPAMKRSRADYSRLWHDFLEGKLHSGRQSADTDKA